MSEGHGDNEDDDFVSTPQMIIANLINRQFAVTSAL